MKRHSGDGVVIADTHLLPLYCMYVPALLENVRLWCAYLRNCLKSNRMILNTHNACRPKHQNFRCKSSSSPQWVTTHLVKLSDFRRKFLCFESALDFVQFLLNQLIPQRRHERIVAELSVEELSMLAYQHQNGMYGGANGVHTLLPYRHPEVAALVQELKYHRNPRALALAAQVLTDELLGISSEALSPPLLVPIPMHSTRSKERGYNQTALLCEAVLQMLGTSVIYEPNALTRIRHTPPQQTLTRAKRLTNVRHSMRADPTLVRGRTVIVLDDVTTTGATLAEARRALLKAGAAQIHCIALAG